MPMPGTSLLEKLKSENKLTYDKWWIDENYKYGDAMLIPKNFDNVELMEQCKKLRYEFNTFKNIIKRLIKGKTNRKSVLRIIIYLVANLISRKEIKAKQGEKLGGSL
jgi:hypothetical protein